MATTQVSAEVSEETKKALDQVSRSTGVKKDHLIEDAILHHLEALRELPTDVVIPPKIVVSAAAAEEIAHRIEEALKPTEKLRRLMAEGQ